MHEGGFEEPFGEVQDRVIPNHSTVISEGIPDDEPTYSWRAECSYGPHRRWEKCRKRGLMHIGPASMDPT